MPLIEGLAGRLSTSNKAKVEWALAVLKQAEPGSTHRPGSDNWDRLRRTMPPAAWALLQELASQGDGQRDVV